MAHDIYTRALDAHRQWKGKIETHVKCEVNTRDDLSLAYSPGVAQPCLEIAKNTEAVYDYTWKGNTIAVVTDGTAVLGLGDIGPEAALPVMEGKALLFKKFGGVDAIPICLNTKDPQEIIQIVKALAPGFGGFNLEDISAPRCVEIERALIEALDVPVFHDDQHGTAIVVIAGLINSLKLISKRKEDLTVVVSGAGSAGSSIVRMLNAFGVKDILVFNSRGVLSSAKMDSYDFLQKEIAQMSNVSAKDLSLKEAMVGADVFVGVSVADIVTEEMVSSMAEKSIVFALANPNPEIKYELAKKAGAFIVGTGRSDYPNQVNNVLAFPGLFKGALAVRAKKITEAMKMAAAEGIASLIEEHELTDEYIIPSPFDPRVADAVAKAVADEALKQQ